MTLYATNRFAGDGTTTQYEINFVGQYIDRSHVKAYRVDDATQVRTPVTIAPGQWLNATTITGFTPTPVGQTLVIYRDTPKPPLVDFVNGSRFTEYNMDLVARQGLFVAMEAMDAGDIAAREQLLAAIAVATGLVDDAAASWEADPRLTDARTPTGAAGGVLSGTYPNPGFAVDMATQAELDAHVAAGSGAHAASAIRNTPAGNISATNVQAAINELGSEKEPTITAGTTAQYWRGDKTWQALNKAAVGLGNADNTSDANKPISAATQAALDGLQAQVAGLASSKLDAAAASFGGNAATATKLQTARTITIGNTGKSFDGSANVSWSLAEIGITSPISVTGPASRYVTQTGTYTITDYDDFATYTVTASHGTVSRSGDTITYTAPSSAPSGGRATITIQRSIQGVTDQRQIQVQILSTSVVQPTVTVAGSPSRVPEAPVIGTSAFQTVGGSDTHASTTWRVRRVADDVVVWQSVNDTSNKTQITVPSGIQQTNTAYRFEAIHNGARLGASPVGFVQATTKCAFAAQIIGLMMQASGGGAGTWTRIDEDFNAISNPGAAYFNNHPTYADIVTQIIDRQQMVKIPKFWFRAGTVPSGPNAGKTYWQIAGQPVSGFSVHPAFIGPGGVELAQIWVGKYQASSSGGKLQSVPGVLPRVSMAFPTARAEAYARNTGGVSGFRLFSDYDLGAIQMLASIELGGLDMQSLIGQGRVSQASAANVDASDVAQATWRGIVGLWGNVWQMLDGIKRSGGNWWRWQYNAPGNTTTSDFATGYVNTGRAALTSSGYPVTFDATLLSAGIIVPATVDGTASNGSTGDYFYSNANTDDRIAYHGGAWADFGAVGLFYLYVYDTPSAAASPIGARLAKV